MFNYNTVFAPTARVERFFKSHTANFPAYARIALVLILAAVSAVLDFVSDHYERIPEYQLRLQLAKVRTHQKAVRAAISVMGFANYHGLDTKAEKLTTGCKALWQRKGELARAAMDKVFCLG